MLHIPPYLVSGDACKDTLFTAYGFILPISVSTGEAALVVGLANAVIVAVFRLLEMRRRDRRDEDLTRLRARVRELEGAQSASGKEAESWT